MPGLVDFSKFKQPPGQGLVDFNKQRSAMGEVGHQAGVQARAASQGVVGGLLTPFAMVGDAFAGVGRDVAYGGKTLLSKTGLVDAPDPRNYYPAGGAPEEMSLAGMAGLDEKTPTSMPAVALANRAARALPDAVGLPEPENAVERLASAGTEGAASMLAPGGVLKMLGKGGSLLSAGLAGTSSGLASQGTLEAGGNGTAAMAAGTLAGLPFGLLHMRQPTPEGFARVKSGTPEGQRLIAGEVARNAIVRGDGEAALPRSVQNLETFAPQVPDYQVSAPAASGSYGMASIADKMQDWSRGAGARMAENNSRVISQGIDKLGGEPGTSALTRAQANQAAAQAFQDMDLSNVASIPVGGLIKELKAGENLRNAGVSQATADARAAIRQRLLDASKPVYKRNAEGNLEPIPGEYRISEKALATARQEIAEARWPKNNDPNSGGRLASIRNAGNETKGHIDQIDGLLNEATVGSWSDYLNGQRPARKLADEQGFMEELGYKAQGAGGRYLDPVDGNTVPDRDISPPSFLAATSDKIRSRPIGGRGKGAKLDNLSPERQDFIARARQDMTTNDFTNRRGIRSQGSNTSQKLDVGRDIDEAVLANRGPVETFLGRIAAPLDAASLAAARAGTAIAGPVGGGAANMGSKMLSKLVGAGIVSRAESAGQGVRSILGSVYDDPKALAELLRQPRPFRPSMRRGLAQGALAGTVLGAGGAMEGQRSSRFR